MAVLLYKYLKRKRAERVENVGMEEIHQVSKPYQLCVHQRDIIQAQSLELSELSPAPHEKAQGEGKPIANGPCVLCKDEKRAATKYRWKLVAGLCLPFAIQALDTTIVAGALPFIASDFHQLGQLNWIVTAFNLTSATFIPAWAQIADVFGRYAALQMALVIMLLGSALCAGSPVTAFPMFLVGRAFLGMGCAGLIIITKTVLADKVSLKENAKNNTIFTLVAGIAYGIGPVIGGYLTQVSWRWCFIINCPLGVIGLVLAHFVLRPELLGPQPIVRTDGAPESEITQNFMARLSTIDFGGQFLFLFGMGLAVLGLTWGGSYYPWSDVKVLAPLIVGAVLVICFLIWEYFMIPGHALAVKSPYRKAMIPLKLIWTRNAFIIFYINFITGMAMYAVFYFVDLYFTLVLNYGAGKAGTNIIYFLPGLAAGAYSAIFFLNVFPRQTWPPLFLGTLIEPLGISLLGYALSTQNTNVIFGMLALTGVGTGLRFMPGTLHGVAYYPSNIASIVSLIQLSMALGGTFGTTIMLNIFNNKMSSAGISFTSADANNFDSISSLSPVDQHYLRGNAKNAISIAFYAISSFMWLGLVSMIGLGNVKIGKKGAAGRGGEAVCKGSYVGSFFRGKEGREGKWSYEERTEMRREHRGEA